MLTTQEIINAVQDQSERLNQLADAIRQEHETMWRALEDCHKSATTQKFQNLYGAYSSTIRLMKQVSPFEVKHLSAAVQARIASEQDQEREAKTNSWQ